MKRRRVTEDDGDVSSGGPGPGAGVVSSGEDVGGGGGSSCVVGRKKAEMSSLPHFSAVEDVCGHFTAVVVIGAVIKHMVGKGNIPGAVALARKLTRHGSGSGSGSASEGDPTTLFLCPREVPCPLPDKLANCVTNALLGQDDFAPSDHAPADHTALIRKDLLVQLVGALCVDMTHHHAQVRIFFFSFFSCVRSLETRQVCPQK